MLMLEADSVTATVVFDYTGENIETIDRYITDWTLIPSMQGPKSGSYLCADSRGGMLKIFSAMGDDGPQQGGEN